MKDIELMIWDYIDGLSSGEERKTIEQLIRSDLEFKAKYEELLELNQDFGLMELEALSMVFTNKVMDKINFQIKPLSAEAKTDKKIIYFISSLFGLMMASCIIVVISQIDWTISPSTTQQIIPNFGQNLNSLSIMPHGLFNNFFYGFLMFDMIVGLMFLDRMMRSRLENL